MKTITGFWICVFGLCPLSVSNLEDGTFTSVLDNKTPTIDLKDTPVTDLKDTPVTDLKDTPVTDLKDTPGTDLKDETSASVRHSKNPAPIVEDIDLVSELDDDYFSSDIDDDEIEETEKYWFSQDEIKMLQAQKLKGLYEEMSKFNPMLGFGETIRWPKIVVDPADKVVADKDEKFPKLGNFQWPTMFPGTIPAALTQAEQLKFLSYHHLYRSNYTYSSANTEHMVFNESLANISLGMAYWCIYDHVFLPGTNKLFPRQLGQNLYQGGQADPSRAMYLWFIEILDFNYVLWKCFGPECGHLTQMQWAESKYIGCNRHLCYPETARYLVVCHYYLPGNRYSASGVPQRGYAMGKNCSLCRKYEGGWCARETVSCARKYECDDPKHNITCDCPLECKNCGVVNKTTCTCDCKHGWDKLDCSQPCGNEYALCPRMPLGRCKDKTLPIDFEYCRARCGMCKLEQSKDPNASKCCDGRICGAHKELTNSSTYPNCTCKIICPGLLCATEPPSSGASGILILVTVIASLVGVLIF